MDAGILRHRVSLFRQAFRTETGTPSPREALTPPQVWASIEPTSPGNTDRMLTYLVRCRYHPELSIDCIVAFAGHDLMVKGIQNVDARNTDMWLYCEEVV